MQPAYYEDEILKSGDPDFIPIPPTDDSNDVPMPDLPSPAVRQQIQLMSLESQVSGFIFNSGWAVWFLTTIHLLCYKL